MRKNTPPKLSKAYCENFRTLSNAWEHGDVALVSALRNTVKLEVVALVCAMQRNADGTITPVPFAEMVNGNPFELYLDPTNNDEQATD